MGLGSVPLLAVLGLVAGMIGRLLLARLRRGAILPPGWCELAGLLLFTVVGLRWWTDGFPGWWLPVPLAVSMIGVPLIAVDLSHRRLPDALTLPAYALFGVTLAACAVVTGDGGMLSRAVLGAAVFGTGHLLIHLVTPGSLGAGDVKLSGSLGGVLGAVGPSALVVAACLAAVVTLVLSLTARLRRGARLGVGVPHAPGLVTATWLVAVFPGVGLVS
ncbi:MAG: prepilin peptidase [Haloechinothrix sp.]